MAEPEFDFDYDKALKYYLHYDFLPRSVMARFIVKRNKEIKNRLRWRTGVVLENRDLKSTAVVKVDERDKKLPKTDGDHYFKVENIVNQIALQKQEVTQHVDVKQETNVEITIDIKVELPAIQENFADLKKLLVNQNAGLRDELKELEDSLDNLHPAGNKESMTGPMNKLFRFLKKLGDEDSEYGKLIAGAEKGVQYAQKLGKGYNNVAQWLALPQIPDLLLK